MKSRKLRNQLVGNVQRKQVQFLNILLQKITQVQRQIIFFLQFFYNFLIFQEIFTAIGNKYLDPSGENSDSKKGSKKDDKSNEKDKNKFKIDGGKDNDGDNKEKKKCTCQ